MKTTSAKLVPCLTLAILFLCLNVAGALQQATGEPDRTRMSSMSMPFIENRGQTDPAVRFYANTFGGTVFVTAEGQMVYSLPGPRNDRKGWALKEELIGARKGKIEAGRETITKVNYLIGNDSTQWRTGIPTFESISLGEVYEGVSFTLKAYGNNVEKLFHVRPGSDPSRIALKLSGGESLNVSEQGQLVVRTPLGAVTFSKPVAFQMNDGKRIPVEVAYKVRGNEYSFTVGDYDKTKELIIDPLLQSTYLGGNSFDYPNAMTVYNGSVYVAGGTSSGVFPGISGGAVTNSYGGFVSKFNSTLTSLLQSTYVGGAYGGTPYALAADSSGIYVAGNASAPVSPGEPGDLPGLEGGAQESYQGSGDAFVMKLNHDLTSVMQSTYLGGSGSDVAQALALSPTALYVGGRTQSTDFLGTSGGAQASHGGGADDGFVAALSLDLTTLAQATYIGGSSGYDYVYGLALDGSNVYAAGYTESPDLPGVDGSSAQPTIGGQTDGFITKFNAGLTAISRTTYVGGYYSDCINAIAAHGGSIYVAGYAYSYNLPYASGGAQPTTTTYNDAFVSKLNADLTAYIQSTYLGGNSDERAEGMAIEPLSGEVYVTGYTRSNLNFPGVTGGAQSGIGGGYDAFVTRLNPGLTAFLQSTYLGGSADDQGKGIAIDGDYVYVTGRTKSTVFPGTAGGAQSVYTGDNFGDVFVARFDHSLAAAGDTTPDTFSFIDQIGVPFNSPRESNVITVSGISEPSPISITGGEYAVSTDGEATWTGWSATTPATGSFRAKVKVRLTSAGDCGIPTNATLTIGGVSDTFTVTTMPCADVSVSMTDAPDPVINGNDVTYTVTVANSGPGEALAVVLTDTLPAGMTFVSGSATQGTCSHAAGAVTCSIGTIPASGTVTVTIVAATPKAGGVIANNVSAATGSYDANPANNTASATTNVLFTSGDVRIASVGYPDAVYTNMQYAYSIIVSNSGPDTATGVTLTDSLPASAVFVSANATQGLCIHTSGAVTCGIGDMAKGATVTVTVTVKAPANPGTLTNTVSVGSKNYDPSTSNNASAAATDVIQAPASGRAVSLPRTGQTTSHATGDDGAVQAGVEWPSPRFTTIYYDASGPCASQANDCDSDPYTDIVRDNLSGLLWARNPMTPGPSECVPAMQKTWSEALLHIKCLNDHAYLGHADWRMPNILEFQSLLNVASTNLMSWLMAQGFQYFYSGMIWTSTSYAPTPDQVWYADLYYGTMNYYAKDPLTSTMYIWPVRGTSNGPAALWKTGQTTCYSSSGTPQDCGATGQDGELQAGVAWPVPRFTSGAGAQADCITDNLTGLMWPKSGTTNPTEWPQALDYANTLVLCGFDDWRLPNRAELVSLVNFHPSSLLNWLTDPAQGFTGLYDGWYWTSTVVPAYGTSYTWATYTATGYTLPYYKTNYGYTLPVRDAFGGADLSVTVTDAPDPVLASASLTYTIVVTNAGPIDALGVVVTDTLPPSVTLSSVFSTKGSCSASGGIVACNVGYLPMNQSATVSVSVITPPSGGLITNTAAVSSLLHDPRASNNTATSETTVGAGTHTFAVVKEGSGTGTVTGSGVSCGASCAASVIDGANVTLTATAGANSRFDGWSGGFCQGMGTCEITLSGNAVITAFFNSTAGPIDLPETGQTTLYATGDDGDLRAGIMWPNPRFVTTYCDVNGPCANQSADCDADTRNDVITDVMTGLMWARDGDMFNLPCSSGVCGTLWDGSMSYIDYYINQGNEPRYANGLCGLKDWRLPNINELLSLSDLEPQSSPSWLIAHGFTNIKDYYWSSTTYPILTYDPRGNPWYLYAWVVQFDVGYPRTDRHILNESGKSHFLPVRNAAIRPLAPVAQTGQTACYAATGTTVGCDATGQDGKYRTGVAWPNPRFTTIYCNASGPCADPGADCDGNSSTDLVRDNLTGLIWARDTDLPGAEAGLLWQNALNFANNLSLCGFDDWRLPNRSEFFSMIDYSQTSIFLPTGHPFVGDFSNHYLFWTSNTDTGDHSQAWSVWVLANMGVSAGFNSKTADARWVWPVRGPVDESPPSATFAINAGAAVTTNATVTLSLAAYDSSGVTEMCISNAPWPCTNWVPFTTTVNWPLLPGDGTKHVYVWFRDSLGNVTPSALPYEHVVVLDMNAPTDGTVFATEGDGQITLDWFGFSDGTGSGIALYKVVYDTNSTPATCADGTLLYVGSASTFPHAGLDNGTTYYYRVCAVDAADHVSAGAAASGIPGADPARIGGVSYPTLQEALNAAVNDDEIHLRAGNFEGPLTFDKPGVRVTLRGGFDATYTGNSSYTYVHGTLTVTRGTVIVERIIIW